MIADVNCGVANSKKYLAVLNVLTRYFSLFASGTSRSSSIDKLLASMA